MSTQMCLAASNEQPGSDLKTRDLFVSRKKSEESQEWGGVHYTTFSWLLTLLLQDGCYPSSYNAHIEDKNKRHGEQRERLFFPWRLCHLVQEGKTSLAHMVLPSGKRRWEIKCLACLDHSFWEGIWNCIQSKPTHSIRLRFKWSNVCKIPAHSNHWRNNSLLLLLL